MKMRRGRGVFPVSIEAAIGIAETQKGIHSYLNREASKKTFPVKQPKDRGRGVSGKL
jgi:hypothetical protein